MNTFVHSDNTLTAVYHENEVLDTSKKVIQAENDFIFFVRQENGGEKELKITTDGQLHIYPVNSHRLSDIKRLSTKNVNS